MNKLENNLTVIVIINSMWGAIEWILPVCKYLKDENGLQIVFIIYRFDSRELFNENTFMEELVNEITNKRCYDLSYFFPKWSKIILRYLRRFKNKPHTLINKFLFMWEKISWEYFSKQSVKKWIYRLKPSVMLKDGFRGIIESSEVFLKTVKDEGCKVICFPTALSFTYYPGKGFVGGLYDFKFKDPRVDFYPADIFIVDNTWDAEYFKSRGKESVVVGTPKFNDSWIKYLGTRFNSKEKLEERSDNNILILLKNNKSLIFQYIEFEKLLEEIIETSLLFEDYNLILKPHPRQDLDILNSIVSKYKSSKVSISHEPSFALIGKSKMIVAMPSGAIFDALIMGRPVIEYCHLKKLSDLLRTKFNTIPKNYLGGMSYLDKDGNTTSVFRALGLVAPADNPEELKRWLGKFTKGESWGGAEKIREIFPNIPVKKAADTIMAVAEQNTQNA
jgi:hypothetical protein